MNSLVILVLIFAAATIAWLSVKAFRLVSQMRQMEKDRDSKKIEERATILFSIRDIANNVLDNGLNITEGSIRIRVLLDHLDPKQKYRDHFIAFYELYEATEHMPRHKDRDRYTCDDLKVYDDEREKIEDEYRGKIYAACHKILEYEFTS